MSVLLSGRLSSRTLKVQYSLMLASESTSLKGVMDLRNSVPYVSPSEPQNVGITLDEFNQWLKKFFSHAP